MVNMFVYRHPGPRSNRLDDTGHFHFRDLEITPSRSSADNGVSTIGLVVEKLPIVRCHYFCCSTLPSCDRTEEMPD